MSEPGSPPLRRILHMIDTGGPGGAETVLADLIEALPRDAWASRVILPRYGWLHERLAESGVDLRVCPSGGSADIPFLLKLVGEVRSFSPDLIHAHLLTAGVYGTMASYLAHGPPLVCTFHGAPDVPTTDPLLWVKSRILNRDTNRIVYVSRNLRRELEARLGVSHRLGRVIHNGVRFLDSPGGEGQPLGLDVPPGEKLVGAVGNVREAKDYPNLLHAARLVRNERSDVRFVVLGETKGPLWDTIAGLKRDLGLEGAVDFLGFTPRAREFVQSFDLFVSSSSTEGLPLAPIEAMGMGKPVVLTRCGGVPEIVDHGDSGLLVPPGNPEALAAGILRLLENPTEAGQLGQRARVDVRTRFSLEAMVDGYQHLYLELLQQGKTRDA